MTSTNSTMQPVVFLFGAGASVDAGIPDTYQFVEDFESHVKQHHSQLHETLLKIIKIREGFNRNFYGSEKKVDIEELLDILQRLISKKDEPLLDFYEEKKFCSTLEENHFPELKSHLEDFVRERVIAEEEKLEYLKELLNFDSPLEIYSTNYDTCIEQLSYLNHRKYTDGFDVYWDKENFEKKGYDVKHYKMHGSVVWYQNEKTKECVKIPVRAFSEEGEPVKLKLIYGEEVKPLLIYPAQKAEYIEPLTDLQLMFKQRLISKETKIVVIVGYSFRDAYIVHMLWDAARVNEDLHVILISPDAQEVAKKVKFIDKETPSRLLDRIICLPYPFSTVIYELKNHYLQKLSELRKTEKENIDNEKSGRYSDWKKILQLAIDCEFLTKAENTFKRLKKNWGEIESDFLRQDWLSYAIKGLLSSVIVNDGNENVWIKRVNEILAHFNAESLQFKAVGSAGLRIVSRQRHTESNYSEFELRDLLNYSINSVFPEKEKKLRLLSPMFEVKLKRINENFEKLTMFQRYISSLSDINNWNQYIELRRDCEGIDRIALLLPQASQNWDEMKTIAMEIEKKIIVKTFGENPIQFKPL